MNFQSPSIHLVTLTMNKLETIELTEKPSNELDEFGDASTGPWCMVFLYHRKGSILVKGWQKTVNEYINKKFPYSFGYMVCYKKKRSWGFWRTFFPLNPRCISFSIRSLDNSCEESSAPFNRNQKKKHFCITARNYKAGKRNSIILRRMPRKWIPEFTELLNSVKTDQ